MNKLANIITAAVSSVALIAVPVQAASSGVVSRMYNPNSGEHVYTANYAEKEMLDKAGWDEEGAGWIAPKTGKPVYRLYNPNAGDHHYTMNVGEKNALVKLGWRDEGVAWYSGGDIPIYRAYNPNAKTGSHFYTRSRREINILQDNGWRAEGIAWYGEDGNFAS